MVKEEMTRICVSVLIEEAVEAKRSAFCMSDAPSFIVASMDLSNMELTLEDRRLHS